MEVDQEEDYFEHGQQIVLHEDKQYYPDAEKVYGKDVEALVMEEDAQALDVPIITPPKEANFQVYERGQLEANYSLDFMATLSQKADLIRSVAICGHLSHGKTLLCDMLVQQTHKSPERTKQWNLNKEYKWTDNRKDEVSREISLKCSPLTLLMQDSREKTYMFNFVDSPGHPCFSDEVTAAFRLSDGAVIVVDCIEGMTFYTERLVTQCVREQIPFVVVLNKLDRLVLELKLPPSDAYYKIKHTLDDINVVIQRLHSIHQGSQPYICPLNKNVVFASTLFSCCFTIGSFAQRYAEKQNARLTGNTATKFERHS